MRKISLDLKAPIDGVYLNSETIELLSIIQCKSIDELKEFAKGCSQLNISDENMQSWNPNNLESVKRELVKEYKETLVSLEQSTKDRNSVLESAFTQIGIPKDEVKSYIETFKSEGYKGLDIRLKEEHGPEYEKLAEKAHRFIASERDQMKSVSYEELLEIGENLKDHNTILIASGRFYDVTRKIYDEESKENKYDFYYPKRGLDFCARNGMHARYHALLDKQTMEEHLSGMSHEQIVEELKEYVKHSIDFISEYNRQNQIDGKGIITSVDLFNEIRGFDPPYQNMWEELHGIGTDELAQIFEYAYTNKPEGVTYVYNEPFLEDPERRKNVLEQLQELNNACPGLIDTIGTQMHIDFNQSLDDIRRCFEDLKESGVKVQITEFDLCLPENYMFNEQGKVRSESELLGLIESKTGVHYESMADFKEKMVTDISNVISDTGIDLEGVTYWSISDTLDHNLERTNRKTFKENLNREVATTRYAGLYAGQEREPEEIENQFEDEKTEKKPNAFSKFFSNLFNRIKKIIKGEDTKMLDAPLEDKQAIDEFKKQFDEFNDRVHVPKSVLRENRERYESEQQSIKDNNIVENTRDSEDGTIR